MVLAALLLGGDDFRRAVTIAASAGYDTDCNAGSVGCLNGVRLGLAAIPADLREPVADRLLVVTAEGGRCVSDAVQPRFAFELPGARQGLVPCPHAPPGAAPVHVAGCDHAGILLDYRDLTDGSSVRVSTPVFLDFDEVADHFSTHASPILYATQEEVARVQAPDEASEPLPGVALYALYYDARRPCFRKLRSPAQPLRPGANTLRWQVPANGGMPLFRLGIELAAPPGVRTPLAGNVRLSSVDWDGAPRDFRQRGMLMSSIWNLRPCWLRAWVSAAREFRARFRAHLLRGRIAARTAW